MMYDELKNLLRGMTCMHDDVLRDALDAIETLEHDNEVLGRIVSKQAAENARLRDALEAADKLKGVK
jgi:hypothetical protein